ncbi:DUF3080 family protein [Halomonas icarae]|uniref:DUF3080 family protein n=1 Tax=Halomonas icarae TaxID=2691040 RepID=A0A7X5AJU4_9GAMM|nr:DUF3080 family protein [Halomonas icarae]MDR5903496.1 DUF3080 family protein [Halomonas icarae]NAW11657.1 DUF3080 family protein [Halomonas icarae]
MANATRFIPDPVCRGIVAIALILMLAGCDTNDASDRLLRDYQRTLAERLDLSPPDHAEPRNIGAFPRLRERRVPIPDTREGLLDIFALRECHITTLVAQRNSTLGLVAPASQRWQYELKLWQRLTACLSSGVADRLAADDLARLEQLTSTKRRQLPQASWNGLFGSEEWAQSFSRVSSPLPPDDLTPPSEQLTALEYLNALSRAPLESSPRPVDLEALERHLQALNDRPYTAQLLRTLLLAEQRLTEANTLLDQALDTPGYCPPEGFSADPRQAPEARRLANWLTALDDAAEAWLTRLLPLFDSLETPPEAVQAYRQAWLSRQNSEAPFPSFHQALQAHLERREALASRCPEA